jgi:hypothetical protein
MQAYNKPRREISPSAPSRSVGYARRLKQVLLYPILDDEVDECSTSLGCKNALKAVVEKSFADHLNIYLDVCILYGSKNFLQEIS